MPVRCRRVFSPRRLAWCSILLLLIGPWPSAQAAVIAEREKTDVIVLKNGDRLTGRIISAQYGMLQLSSSFTGSVSIEWRAVQSITSKYMFRVERAGGAHFEGLISSDPEHNELRVNTAQGRGPDTDGARHRDLAL